MPVTAGRASERLEEACIPRGEWSMGGGAPEGRAPSSGLCVLVVDSRGAVRVASLAVSTGVPRVEHLAEAEHLEPVGTDWEPSESALTWRFCKARVAFFRQGRLRTVYVSLSWRRTELWEADVIAADVTPIGVEVVDARRVWTA